MTIYYVTPDVSTPCGGVKTRYRHVDLLNRNNIPACILHEKPGFRCSWFENSTVVTSFPQLTKAHRSDLLVLSELHGPTAHTMAQGLLKKVIFNQGIFNTFNGYSLDQSDRNTPYLSDEVLGIIVNSAHAADYLQYTFPNKPVYHIHYGIDSNLFHPRPKKRQIAYFTSKNVRDQLQLLNMLKFRGAFAGWNLAPIADKTENEVADILGESLIALNFTEREGFGMPAVEALASGCIVVGYDAICGAEYMLPAFSYPVAHGDILQFSRTLESVLQLCFHQPELIAHQAKAAVDFVQHTYYPLREEQELLTSWKHLLTEAGT